jgi:hypothetical protein
MLCKECPDYKENFCEADMFKKEHSIGCLLKMLIQEIRLMRDEQWRDIIDGDEWKYGNDG